MPRTESTAIGVLGMHRSGTSVTARVVNLLGAYVGAEEELVPRTADNPEGYWEHQSINDLHEDLLVALGRTWDTTLPLPSGWHRSDRIVPFRDQLMGLIESVFAGHALWAWKDPRSSILLPLWKDALAALGVELRCLLVFRNPLDVARSLQVRDGFARDESLGLWFNHNLAMLQNSTGLRRSLVSYQEVLTDPVSSAARWAPHLSLRSPADHDELQEALRRTIRPDLCHSASTLADVTAGCPEPVIELTRLLHSMAENGKPAGHSYHGKVQRLAETHDVFAALCAHDFIRVERSNREIRAELSQSRERLTAAEQELTRSRWRREAAEAQLTDAQARIDRLLSTYSWRITRPLRRGLDLLQSIQGKLRAFSRGLPSRAASLRRRAARLSDRLLPESSLETASPGHLERAPPQTVSVPRIIAFYLPQFHPIPENDRWWGKGFTEWRNVTRARPLFTGHYQPRLPSDLGYYDLRVPEIREAQAELARAHGIHGFCYYYYWFGGRRLLERPLQEMLDSGRPDLPFCVCWANESWSRRWDGAENEILIAQEYGDGFATRLADDLVPYLLDRRYIRVDGRPLLIVYRTDQIPQLERTVATWREVFRNRGVGEVCLAAVEGFGIYDPTPFGFDAAVEFPPHNPAPGEHRGHDSPLRSSLQNLRGDFHGLLRDYRDCARARSHLSPPGYPLFRGVVPSWDNTARNKLRALVYHHASPEVYQAWLTAVLTRASEFSAPLEPVVFVNAWNEWAEGAYLEPDAVHGDAYLRATNAAIRAVRSGRDGRQELAAAIADESPPISIVTAESRTTPEVTIVIPAFNQVQLTRECLRSLHGHQAGSPFEVVVVDDGSSDETPGLADEMPWLRLVRREENGGFGSACNLGAEQARGDYLVFLNNDTTVCEGWLDALRETFELWPRAGIVGSKLVLLDGTMQECGGLIYRDGSAANYGRGGDPQDPRYCFTRQTDYVSGAAMMMRRDLFGELGGFDPLYDPAYYEDTDLSMRVRESGLQVVVNPHAVVRHHEGGTAGTDTRRGIKRYQVVNQHKFYTRWRDVLARHPSRPTGEPVLSRTGPRVLVVDWIIPRPDRDSGSLRMAGILNALRRLDCQVTVAAQDLRCDAGYELSLERIGIEVLRRPYVEALDEYLRERGETFDYVIVSRRDTARRHLASAERYCPGATLIYDTCDLHFVREGREAALEGTGARRKHLGEMKAVELDQVARSDVTLVVSPQEREVLHRFFPRHDVRILSNIVEPRPTSRPFAERSGLVFIGFLQFSPNVDGVLWFATEVLPKLARRGLEPVFHVVGSDPPPELRALESDRISVHGFVPDVDPLFDSCRLSVAPLRFGAGVKGKISQSMALGVPCVSTSIGAEGTFLENCVSGMVADTPADFAAAIEAAYQRQELWSALRQAGLRTVEQHFSPRVATAVLKDLIT